MSTTIFLNITIVYTIIHSIYALASASMEMNSPTRTGMNPDKREKNAIILFALFFIIYSLFTTTPSSTYIPMKITGTIALLIGLRCIMSLIQHFSQFLQHTAKVRRARIIYEETGQKTDRSIQGYASFNTLMLSGVIAIIGAFCLNAVAYHCFTFQLLPPL